MDELTITEQFDKAMDRAVGSVSRSQHSRIRFVKRMSAKLSEHFNQSGWPKSEDEVMTYVQQAIDRYC